MPKNNDPEEPRPYDADVEHDENDIPSARPIPVSAPVGADDVADEYDAPAGDYAGAVATDEEPPPPSDPLLVERPLDELGAGIAALVLSASVFLPWYSRPTLDGVSGWTSGSWGPIIFFLGLAAFAIVLIRRLR
ncbi:MAG TPA: hypothetical protein VM600_01935, partial [Actinomycetota bacterium]|nr:hypothetical protein [Actinomycetota bacterium]